MTTTLRSKITRNLRRTFTSHSEIGLDYTTGQGLVNNKTFNVNGSSKILAV